MDNLAQLAIDSALCGNWEKAIKQNLLILKTNSNDIEALNRLCKAYLEMGLSSKAKSVVKKILDLDRYNPIAQKLAQKCKKYNLSNHTQLNQSPAKIFIEEPGKTKTISLIHLGSKDVIMASNSGDKVEFNTYGHRVTITTSEGKLIGKLTDDMSTHLKKLVSMGFEFETYIKSVHDNDVRIIIREIKKPKKYSKIISFTTERFNYVSYTPPELVHEKISIENDISSEGIVIT